jgi:hypothetical protein
MLLKNEAFICCHSKNRIGNQSILTGHDENTQLFFVMHQLVSINQHIPALNLDSAHQLIRRLRMAGEPTPMSLTNTRVIR